MGENTKIEWATHTFNPWIGCQKVSPGCDHCYAESLATRYGWTTWGPHGERKLTSDANWRKPLQWARAARKAGVRERVFCASLADWLDNQAPAPWRERLAVLIDETPEIDWLLLTKRIENFDKLAPWHADDVPPNVWLGITCEDQERYDRRWPILAGIGARVRFISYEPALGPLRLGAGSLPCWVIAGGESGHGARPAHPQWFRDLRDECAASGVAFLFKQWGEFSPGPPVDHILVANGEVHEFQRRLWAGRGGYAGAIPLNRVGKARAGRLLDGRTHDEMPEVNHVR